MDEIPHRPVADLHATIAKLSYQLAQRHIRFFPYPANKP